MGLFSRKDWNVIAVTFERNDMFRINGNRATGSAATKTRDGAKNHSRTIYWAVFDQKGAFQEGEAGQGQSLIPPDSVQRLMREIPTNHSILQVLRMLEGGQHKRVAKPLIWGGYANKEQTEKAT